MDDFGRNRIPAFGNWDYASDLPITQYFESARQAGLLRYSCYGEQDLYGAGDLYYYDDLKKPARAVVTHRKTKGTEKRYPHVKEQKKQGRVYDVTEPVRQKYVPPPSPPPPLPVRAPKAVDEDLYKIPPELLHTTTKRKKMFGFFSKCLVPTCSA